MKEQPVLTDTDHDYDGWRRVAQQMADWHPDLQKHARRHLALRGLLPETEAPTDTNDVQLETQPTLEVIGDSEKLKKGIKIVVGGPPHSGKSVFIEALTKNLDKDDTFAFSACPDGEGPWLQRHYDDPEVVKWRQKGQFTPEFVDRAKRVVDEWEGPLMLIDIGGRTSEENAQIVEGATHAIVLAGDLSKVDEWQEFFRTRGVEVIAVLHSHYHGNSDQIVDKDKREENPELRLGRLTASVHHLERGEPAEDRLTIKEVAASIHALVENNTTYQEAHETGETSHFVVDLPSFLGELPSQDVEKTLPSGKVVTNRQLQRAALPLLYEKVDKSFIAQPVWLDGPINSWEAIALASAFAGTDNPDIRMRGPDGFIKLEALPQQGDGDTVEWQVSQTGELGGRPIITVHAIVSASTRLVKPEELATMHIPEVPEDSIVIISTAGPNWLRSSIALGYKDHCQAVAAFVPGEGSTIAWSRDHSQLGKITERLETPVGLHHKAVALRNPYQDRLISLSEQYSDKLLELLPEGARIELGGSLVSRTALKGHNDIDLRVLLPEAHTTEAAIRELSSKIDGIIPYQKDRPVGSKSNQQFAIMHQLDLELPEIDGNIEIEVSVRPAEGYIGYANLQSELPEEILDQYVVYKSATQAQKSNYKKVKEQFYAMNRWLYSHQYMDGSTDPRTRSRLLNQAIAIYWGHELDDILNKPEPDV